MADEPSNGELARRQEAMHNDLKEDLRDIARRLDGKVSSDVFKLEQAAQDRAVLLVLERLTAIEEARKKEAEQAAAERRAAAAQRASDRRLLFSALVVPVLLVLFQAWLSARGAGS